MCEEGWKGKEEDTRRQREQKPKEGNKGKTG